jgi:hypothetical protein
MNFPGTCGCTCPVLLPLDNEIKKLEDHKKILQQRVEMIDTKINRLMTVNKP